MLGIRCLFLRNRLRWLWRRIMKRDLQLVVEEAVMVVEEEAGLEVYLEMIMQKLDMMVEDTIEIRTTSGAVLGEEVKIFVGVERVTRVPNMIHNKIVAMRHLLRVGVGVVIFMVVEEECTIISSFMHNKMMDTIMRHLIGVVAEGVISVIMVEEATMVHSKTTLLIMRCLIRIMVEVVISVNMAEVTMVHIK